MEKYIFTDNKLINTPYCHANYIQKDYDITVRLIIFEEERIIYIRINDLTVYQGLEFKRVEYKFEQNLKACETYLERNYKKHKVYNSYSISELSYKLQKDILSS